MNKTYKDFWEKIRFHVRMKSIFKMNWNFKPEFPMKPQSDGRFLQVADKNGNLYCPYCGGVKWIEGPEGGGSQNIQCDTCLKYYNDMGPFGLQDIGDRSAVWGKRKG